MMNIDKILALCIISLLIIMLTMCSSVLFLTYSAFNRNDKQSKLLRSMCEERLSEIADNQYQGEKMLGKVQKMMEKLEEKIDRKLKKHREELNKMSADSFELLKEELPKLFQEFQEAATMQEPTEAKEEEPKSHQEKSKRKCMGTCPLNIPIQDCKTKMKLALSNNPKTVVNITQTNCKDINNFSNNNLPALKILKLQNNNIMRFDLNKLPKIQFLDVSNNNLTQFTNQDMPVKTLNLSHNKIRKFQNNVFTNRPYVILLNNSLTSFKLDNNIEQLSLRFNKIMQFSNQNDNVITRLYLGSNSLQKFVKNRLPMLEILTLDMNNLVEFDCQGLKNLRQLNLTKNKLDDRVITQILSCQLHKIEKIFLGTWRQIQRGTILLTEQRLSKDSVQNILISVCQNYEYYINGGAVQWLRG